MNGIYWIYDEQPPRLAIVARPRGDAWLGGDLAALHRGAIDILVSLLPEDEARALGLSDEAALAQQVGLEFLSYPIPDRCVPDDLPGFRQFVARLADAVRAGQRVGAHCRGCIGRSTVLIAAIMIALGTDAGTALRQIEDARGWEVPDTPQQRDWILQFRPTVPLL